MLFWENTRYEKTNEIIDLITGMPKRFIKKGVILPNNER